MRNRAWLSRALLFFLGLLVPLLFFEGIVFRYWLPAAQLPDIVFERGLLRYEAGQTGVMRVRDEIAAPYRINDAGWNSGHEAYTPVPSPGVTRVAVIGDSYVEALQVTYDHSFAEQLEARLGPEDFEVYRFGISGAPLSHYLQMLRQEVVRFQPDLVIINVTHNDFAESYTFRPGVYNSSFLKLDVQAGTVTGEIEPAGYERPWYSAIRDHSAIWGYFVYRQRLDVSSLRRLFLSRAPAAQAAVTGTLVNDDPGRAVTAYVLREMKTVALEHDFDLLVLVDADRVAIYDGAEESANMRLNEMVGAEAAALALPFIDLHPVFAADFAANGRAFEFVYDSHWNVYAHGVVADAIFRYITDETTGP